MRAMNGMMRSDRDGQARGFTLLETLITMAIGAILLTIGVPSFMYVTNSNRATSEVNGLLGDLQFARAEAIKEGVTVTACVSTDGQSCTGGTSWNGGWMVFSDPTDVGVRDAGEPVLKIQNPFSSTDTLVASNNVSLITFNREGYATGIANGTQIALHDATSNTAFTRCLSITFVGLMATERYDAVNANTGVACQ
jgi:type IV fimbrial biogenesis protein FimT